MSYYVIWYEDYLEEESIDRDIVRDDCTNKIAIFLNKDNAERIANSLTTASRTLKVEPHIKRYIDENYYILMG